MKNYLDVLSLSFILTVAILAKQDEAGKLRKPKPLAMATNYQTSADSLQTPKFSKY